jgi:two-component system sensor histidine kinase BarA
MKLGLHRRILLLTLLPTIVIGCGFSIWFSYEQYQSLNQQLEQRGLASATRLADAFEYGLLERNSELLQKLAREALNEPDARSVLVLDHDLKILAQAGPNMLLSSSSSRYDNDVRILDTPTSLRFRVPIDNERTSLYRAANPDMPSIVGWAELEFTTAHTRIKQYQSLLFNLIMLLLALTISGSIALIATRGIIGPVQRIKQGVDQIRDGQLESRIQDIPEGEMGDLADGINSMAESLHQAYQEMQENIDQATQDLRETLETIEVQNIELDMARREALEASRIKSEFLANMSHEIRTPLNGIIGFTRLLNRTQLNTKQTDYTRTILSSSESLLTIINDVLDFAKIEAGKLQLDKRAMNLRDTIEDVLVMLAPTAMNKDLELLPLIYSDVPNQIIGDQLRIKQVLTNLINNAIKFTDHGEVVVRVALEQQRGEQTEIRISVTDTGIGLTKDQQRALFSAFQQADNSTAREFGGTGLGLAISKRLVEQMDGDIGVESEPGTGSTFWFTLRTEPVDGHDSLPDDLKDQTVLLYENREISRISRQHQLKGWQIDVINAEQLDQIEDLVEQYQQQQKNINVVLLGLDKGQMRSQDTVRLLRQLDDKNVPCILLVNGLDQGGQLTDIESLVCRIIEKPVRSQTLFQALFHPQRPVSVLPDSKIQRNKTSDLLQMPSILTVDDNPANLKLIATLLEGLGCNVTAVESGKAALDRIEHQHFDLVFMDIQMPQMDGIETTERIRVLEKPGDRIPIVALTAHALAGERENLLHRGMDDYLTKPVDEEQLKAIIEKWTGMELPEPSGIQSTISDSEFAIEIDDQMLADEKLSAVDLILGLKKAGGKRDLALEMLTMLLETLPQDQQLIGELFYKQDYPSMLEQVHRLHGATHYCGVPELQLAAQEVEVHLKRQRYQELGDAVASLNIAIEQVISWSDSVDLETAIEQAYEHQLNTSATSH